MVCTYILQQHQSSIGSPTGGLLVLVVVDECDRAALCIEGEERCGGGSG